MLSFEPTAETQSGRQSFLTHVMLLASTSPVPGCSVCEPSRLLRVALCLANEGLPLIEDGCCMQQQAMEGNCVKVQVQ